MCTKTEEKILLASRPYIKKTQARVIVGCSHDNFRPIWNKACMKYEKQFGPIPSFGLPTKFFLDEVNISRDQLVELAEYEKRFNA